MGIGSYRFHTAAAARRRKLFWGVVWGCVAVLLGVAAGTAVTFFKSIPQAIENTNGYDGVVVFTGGQGRIQAGFDALTTFPQAQHLLISGVNPSTSLEAVLTLDGTKPTTHQNKVELDYISQTTFGNIEQTKIWAEHHGLQHVVVVTSNYHAPRVALLLEAYVPQVVFNIYPVVSEHTTLWLWLFEFAKYAAVRFDLALGGIFFAL